jgi:hypothetical protein
MPKRMMSGGGFGDTFENSLPGWQATGLALAAIGSHVLVGSGAFAFAVLAAGVIWALHRLHVNAPGARSTADLIASVIGTAPARAVGVVQYVAYLLLAAFTASSVAMLTVTWAVNPDAASSGWLWAAMALAVAGIAGVLVALMPVTILAPAVTALAGFGLLVYFYLALAVLAKVYSGTAPIDIGTAPPLSKFGAFGVVITLAMSLVAFEIPSTAADRLRSMSRPLGYAMALMVLCCGITWLATNVGATGSMRYDATDLVYILTDMFSGPSGLWVIAATTALASAWLIVLIWGATRAAPDPLPSGAPGVLAVTVITAVLAVAVCRGWGDLPDKLWGVAGILILVVYVGVAHANSRLDDSSSIAWGVFALMALALVVVTFVVGAGISWWPVGLAAGVVAIAVAVAATSRQSGKPNSLTTL